MLKMERGAARAASGNTRVIEMEELKKARERRASSVRHPGEEPRETRRGVREETGDYGDDSLQPQDSLPFWEQDDPFRPSGKPTARKPVKEVPAFWEREEPEEDFKPEKQAAARPIRTARGQGRQESRTPVTPSRRNDRPQGRPEFNQAARSSSERTQTRRDSREGSWQGERYQPRKDDRQTARNTNSNANTSSSHAGLYMLMVLLGLVAVIVFIGMKIFEIKQVDVKGNDTMTAQSVIALSGISAGENIFKVNLGQAKRNLESDPLLEVLGISRAFPDRIKINVRQRKPHGAIAYLGSYVIIDEKGFVLDVRDSLPAGQYPLVTGIDIKPSVKGKPLAGVSGDKLKIMYKLLSALYDNKAMQIVGEANVANEDDIQLLTGEGIQVDLGKPTDLDKKAQWVACSIPELRSKGYTTGVLYVTGTNSPVYSAPDNGQQQDGQTTGKTEDGNGGDGSASDGQDDSPDNAA